jgi:hypothetical protein
MGILFRAPVFLLPMCYPSRASLRTASTLWVTSDRAQDQTDAANARDAEAAGGRQGRILGRAGSQLLPPCLGNGAEIFHVHVPPRGRSETRRAGHVSALGPRRSAGHGAAGMGGGSARQRPQGHAALAEEQATGPNARHGRWSVLGDVPPVSGRAPQVPQDRHVSALLQAHRAPHRPCFRRQGSH